MVMVFISCTVRFWQEYRSSVAIFRLQSSITTAVKTLRGEVKMVPAADLVPGDVIKLSPGDTVPADCLILESSFLRVSQSQWTGESDPAPKCPSVSGEKGQDSVFDLGNIVLMGTGVVAGHGMAVVLRTGSGKFPSTGFPIACTDADIDVLIAAMSKELSKSTRSNAFQRGIRYVTWMLIGFMCVMVPIVSTSHPYLYHTTYISRFWSFLQRLQGTGATLQSLV